MKLIYYLVKMTNTIVTGKPLLICHYEWKLTSIDNKNHQAMTILSKIVKFNGESYFRAGLKIHKNPSNPPILLFITTNLNKWGMKVVKVVFSSTDHVGKNSKMTVMKRSSSNIGADEQDVITDGSIQLFTSTQLLIRKIENGINFAFEIYGTGIVDNFQIQQMDSLIANQFISLLNNESDFELVFMNTFKIPVHKFMLAARSPVFSAKFDSDKNVKEEEITCCNNIETAKQFVHFVYTGTLNGVVIQHRQLAKLAKMYQITTLEALCKAASYDIDGEQIMELPFQFNLESDESSSVLVKSDEGGNSEINFQAKTIAIDCTWNYKKWPPHSEDHAENKAITSEPFEYQGQKLFKVQVKSVDSSSINHFGVYVTKYDFSWIFLRYPSKKTGGHRIESVSYTATIGGRTFVLKKMQEKQTTDGNFLQVFTSIDTNLEQTVSFPFTVTFNVKLLSTVENVALRVVDFTWKDQLWASSVNRKLTDVELLVGEKTFSAHRSLLSIRSPVFEAMFNSGMKEALTGQVRIGDVEPDTFGHFLHFLYTGILEPGADKEDLYLLADRYQVETLVNLCQPASEPVDVEGITKAFLSC